MKNRKLKLLVSVVNAILDTKLAKKAEANYREFHRNQSNERKDKDVK